MNKALKGNNQEIILTKELNRKEKYWNELDFDINNTYAIHIIYKKFGIINEKKISSKADIFLANGEVPTEYLAQNDYYLSEDDLIKLDLNPVKNSGISIKLPGSKYTITKISPSTFEKIFGSNILGAGASIYCEKEKDFNKNKSVLDGWRVNKFDFMDYFNKELNISVENLIYKKHLVAIKKFSNNKIASIINNSKSISDFISMGIGNFEEPYTAKYIIENDRIKKNYYIPYKITTGSGRSKGIFTIVLKPR